MSRKRKDSSPIKTLHDFHTLLRKQEVSASPVLKRCRAAVVDGVEAVAEEEDEEVAFLGANVVDKMGNTEMDGNKSTNGPATTAMPSFSFQDFTMYMDEHVNSKMDLLTLGVSSIKKRVEEHGDKLDSLEQRVLHLEGSGSARVSSYSRVTSIWWEWLGCCATRSLGSKRNDPG